MPLIFSLGALRHDNCFGCHTTYRLTTTKTRLFVNRYSMLSAIPPSLGSLGIDSIMMESLCNAETPSDFPKFNAISVLTRHVHSPPTFLRDMVMKKPCRRYHICHALKSSMPQNVSSQPPCSHTVLVVLRV